MDNTRENNLPTRRILLGLLLDAFCLSQGPEKVEIYYITTFWSSGLLRDIQFRNGFYQLSSSKIVIKAHLSCI